MRRMTYIKKKTAIVFPRRLKANPACDFITGLDLLNFSIRKWDKLLIVLSVLLMTALACSGCSHYVTRVPDPETPLVFPADHGGHDDAQWEWWYYNGHLVTESGKSYDYFFSFFKVYVDGDTLLGMPMQFLTLPLQMYFPFIFGGFSIVDNQEDTYQREYECILPDFWSGKYRKDDLDIRLGVHKAWRDDDNTFHVQTTIDDYELDLVMRPQRPPLLYGNNRKGTLLPPDTVHRYYSYTRMQTQGTLTKKGRAPVAVQGSSWMDHEYGLIYNNEFKSWDWIGMTLDNGMDVVFGVVQYFDGTVVPQSFCTVRLADGRTAHLEAKDFQIRPVRKWTSPRTRITYGIDWEMRVPALDLHLRTKATKDRQEMSIPPMVIWEGPCNVEGTVQGQKVRGRAFLETWGDYEVPFRKMYRSRMRP